jgi:predicted ATP-grasp superfamily ATP-dependent carboligase
VKKTSVLITEGMYKHSLGIVRALGKAGYQIGVIGNQWEKGIAGYSRYCSKYYRFKNFSSEKDYIEQLLLTIKSENYAVVIPIGFPIVEWVSRHRNQIEKYSKLVLPDHKLLGLLSNKKTSQELARKHGIPVPGTWYPANEKELEGIMPALHYPVVIKAVDELGYNQVEYVKNEEELRKAFLRPLLENKPPPLVQEYLTGKACGYFGFFDHGVSLQSFVHERIREYPATGGSSSCAMSVQNDEILKFGKKLLSEIKYHGVAMVEFKYNSTGKPMMLEVNPKFWGSFDLSFACGINFPDLLVKNALNERVETNRTYKEGLTFSWFFDTDWRNAKNQKKVLTYILQLFKKNTSTNFWFTDPVPSVIVFYKFLVDFYSREK